MRNEKRNEAYDGSVRLCDPSEWSDREKRAQAEEYFHAECRVAEEGAHEEMIVDSVLQFRESLVIEAQDDKIVLSFN